MSVTPEQSALLAQGETDSQWPAIQPSSPPQSVSKKQLTQVSVPRLQVGTSAGQSAVLSQGIGGGLLLPDPPASAPPLEPSEPPVDPAEPESAALSGIRESLSTPPQETTLAVRRDTEAIRIHSRMGQTLTDVGPSSARLRTLRVGDVMTERLAAGCWSSASVAGLKFSSTLRRARWSL